MIGTSWLKQTWDSSSDLLYAQGGVYSPLCVGCYVSMCGRLLGKYDRRDRRPLFGKEDTLPHRWLMDAEFISNRSRDTVRPLWVSSNLPLGHLWPLPAAARGGGEGGRWWWCLPAAAVVVVVIAHACHVCCVSS